MLNSSDSELEPYIALQDINYRPSTTLGVRLLVFLYYVCTRSNYTVVSNQFGLGISTVSKCVHEVTYAILSHMWKAYICLPMLAEIQKSMYAWEQQTGISGIVGALDGTHIEIRKPAKEDADVPFNRKCRYSVNVQGFQLYSGFILTVALVDYRKRFIDVEVGWPGSVGDGRVFRNS